MKKMFCCPALELFHCLTLRKTVRLHGKKLQNATNYVIYYCFSFLLIADMMVHNFKLSALLTIILFFKIKSTNALVKCNGTVTELQLCSLADKYQKGVPPGCKGCQSYEIKTPAWTILWFKILGIFSVENIDRLDVFMFQT